MTIQLLVADRGNRAAVRDLLEDEYRVVSDPEVQDSDLYLVDDHTYPRYQEELEERVERNLPKFTPVLLIRREDTPIHFSLPDPGESGDCRVVDDIIEAPLEPNTLYHRIDSLVARRRQSVELKNRVSELEEREGKLEELNGIVRHDVRNEMNVLLGHLIELEMKIEEGNLLKIVNRAKGTCEQVIELTETTRKLVESVIEGGSELEPVPLGGYLENTVEKYRAKHPEAEIELEGEVPEVDVLADNRLTSVFRNLLTNSIEHNDRGTPHITISVEEDTDEVTAEVADNGAGLTSQQKRELFENDRRDLRDSDSGLGLILVDQLVQNYGGEVEVVDNEPRGAAFRVNLKKA